MDYEEVKRRTDLNTALIEAAKNGEVEKFHDLMIKGAHPNKRRGKEGYTPMMWAAENGHAKAVGDLIAYNNNTGINSRDNQLRTVLMIAVASGHKEVVEVLIKSGAAVNARDKENKTALAWATEKGHENIIEVLKKARAGW